MKINNINGVTFGYNKNLNNNVNNRLSKKRGIPEVDQSLLELNKYCINTEKKLRSAEKHGETDLVNFYSNLLITIKPQLAEEINERFPDINYRQKEIDSYNDEIKRKNIKDVSHWLITLSESLEIDESTSQDYDSRMETKLPKSILFNQVVDDEDAKSSKQVKDVVNNIPNSVSNLVEMFDPTIYKSKAFNELGGLSELKEMLEEELIEPLLYPDMAKADEEEYGIKVPSTIMLYGPPGCGKTTIAEAISVETGINLYKLKLGRAGSEFVNKTSKNIQEVFDYLKNVASKSGKPVLLFMDEVESMTPNRNGKNLGKEDLKVVSTLLPLISDARKNNIIIISATNCMDMVDPAIKNRFEYQYYIGLPDKDTRKEILYLNLNKIQKGKYLANNSVELDKIANATQGFSGRTLEFFISKASRIAKKNNRANIQANDILNIVANNQDKKIKEINYKSDSKREPIGFRGA